MPLDRLLHPKCGHGEKPSGLSSDQFRVWVQYMLSADDFGVMRCSAVTLRADNTYLDGKPERLVQKWLNAVVSSGLIRTFTHQGREYAFQWDWQTWQKVSYPRATNNPKPDSDCLSRCDQPTQELFQEHPGGKGRKFHKRSENVSETVSERSESVQEKFPTTRAGAPAERLTANANGKRQTAEGGSGETPPLDRWFRDFVEQYPAKGVTTSHLTETAFVDVVLRAGTPQDTYRALCERLEGHKRSHQWRVKGMIPRLDRYLREGLHLQELPEFPPDVLVNEKSSGTLGAASAILQGKV